MDRKTKNILSIFFIALTIISGAFAIYLAYVQQTTNFDRRTDAQSTRPTGRCQSKSINRVCWQGNDYFLLGANLAWTEWDQLW